ncbi:unnamed protein product [Rhizopus stolonifer]
MKFDFETLWSSAQIQRAIILERNEVSVKLVRASGKQIQNKLDAATDKDDSERGLPRVDSDGFADHPEDENDHPEDENDHSEDENDHSEDEDDHSEDEDDHSEQENLLYSIKDNGKRFWSAVSSSEDTPECLKLFKTFQEKSFAQAKSVGLFVNAHLHEILSLYNTILLKKEQSYSEVDMSVLYKDMLDEYKNYEKVDKDVFSEITEAFRIDETGSSRDELKIMLFRIYEKAKKEDRKMIDVLVNMINKLPNQEIIDNDVEEQELITNYIDPILSPILHRPEGDKLFLWLNKTALKSYNKRPDAGCAVILKRRVINYSGFVEVKAEYKKKDAVSLHEDLLRLSLFGINGLEENNAKCILLIQIIGSSLTVYGCAKHAKGPKIIFEIMNFKIPLSLQELPGFIMKLDELKRLSYFYHERCVKRLETMKRKYSSSNSNIDLDEIINSHTPKSLKSSIDF